MDYLTERKISPKEVPSIDQAYADLAAGRSDAIVYDAPVLRHYSTHTGQGSTKMVGGMFSREDYGIALPPQSPLRQRIDTALLQLREDGTYDRLVSAWFGAGPT